MSRKKLTAVSPNAAPPTPSLLGKLEDATIDVAARLLSIPTKPAEEKLVTLTRQQQEQLIEIERDAIVGNRTGDLVQLEAALGMLRMGHYWGWKVLYIIHSKKTIRTYEEILGVKVRDIFPEEGPSAYRSFGFNLAKRFSNFWKVVGGDIKITRRQDAA